MNGSRAFHHVLGSLVSALLFGACSSSMLASTPELPDLSATLPDLRSPAADLASDPDMRPSFICRGADAPGTLLKQATNALLLPRFSGPTYAMDIDGDGKPENQFKVVLQQFAIAGLGFWEPIDDAVMSGALVYLADLTTLRLDSSACTGVTLQLAKPRRMGDPSPKYDGTDIFTKDLTAKAELAATISTNVLDSKQPKDLSKTEEARIDLKLYLSGMPLVLPLRGIHIQGTLIDMGGKLFIQDGQLHGVISKKDIDGKIIPGFALITTQLINADPTDTTALTLVAIFEDPRKPISQAKCMVPADCCRTSPSTCKILTDEVQAFTGQVLAPDIQAFDDLDAWAPIPGGAKKNGMSLGIGFATVPAIF